MGDHQDPWSTWIWNSNLAQPLMGEGSLPGDHWVEVIHQKYSMDGDATWMYYTPGTALWFNLGNTRAWKDHDSAVLDLLMEGCKDTLAGLTNECIPQFPRLYAAAIQVGLDSLQFEKHADMPCGKEQHRQNMAIEIVDLGGPGTEACSQHTSGPNP